MKTSTEIFTEEAYEAVSSVMAQLHVGSNNMSEKQAKYALTLAPRPDGTKNDSKRIRRAGDIPAIVYDSNRAESQKFTVSGAAFQTIMRRLTPGQLSTHRFTLQIDGKAHQAFVKGIQYHPVTYAVEHLDFLLLQDRPVVVAVPIQLEGISECTGVKLGGMLRQILRSMRVSGLPKDIPNVVTLDVRNLGIAETLRLSDVSLPEGLKPLSRLSEVVVTISKGKA